MQRLSPHRAARLIAGLSAGTLAAVGLAAGAAPAAQAAAVAARHAKPLAADQAARSQAVKTGKAVTITADTTSTSLTVANPDGTFTNTTHALPVRVMSGGKWRAIRTVLHRDVSGSFTPGATPSRVTLSGGGTTPLAVLAGQAGSAITIRFPGTLPRPAIAGSTATYASVSPGENLSVTVTQLGGVNITLTASRHGRLRSLTLPVSTSGIALRSDSAGNLVAGAPGGRTQFTGTSYQTFAPTRADRGGAPDSSARPVLAGHDLVLATGPAAQGSAGRHVAASASPAAATTPQSVTAALTPDAATGCSTDPPFKCTKDTPTSSTIGYTEVRQGSCQSPLWNVPQTNGEAVGLEDYNDDSCGDNIIYRTYYAFNPSSLFANMIVQNSTFFLDETYGSDHSCTDTWPVSDYTLTAGSGKLPGPSTVWSNRPAQTMLGTRNLKSAGCSSNGSPEAQFNVTSQIAGALTASVFYLGIAGDESASTGNPETGGCSGNYNCGFMRFDNNPYIVTTYDDAPAAPTLNPMSPPDHTINSPAGGAGCVNSATAYPWIGAQDRSSLVLSVVLTPKLTSEQIRAKYGITDTTDPGLSVTAGLDSNDDPGSTGDYSNWWTNTPATTTTGITWPSSGIGDGHVYKWSAQAEVEGIPTGSDGPYDSPSAGPCYFGVDLTAPMQPAVTSTTYPPSGSTQFAGGSGTFTFSAADPVPTDNCTPGPCVASGVAGYLYSLNTPIPAIGGKFTATPSVNLTVGNWGDNTLYVQAEDNAGNFSQPDAYTFYVPWNPGALRVPGDVDGDGQPDLLGTTSAGGLNLYTGPVTSSLTPSTTTPSSPGDSPDGGTDWNDFQITHRGSVTQQGSYDDLYAHDSRAGVDANNLYLYQNNPSNPGVNAYGTGSVVLVSRPVCASNCANYPGGTSNPSANWSDVAQILSPGDAWTGVTGDPGLPSLFTVENGGELWAYQGAIGNALTNPVELGTGWGNTILIAPGTITNQLTIWALNKTTNVLYSYPIYIVNNEPSLSPAANTPVAFGSGTAILTLPAGTYPTLASTGDNTTGSTANLYVINSTGAVTEYKGTSGNSPGATTVSPLSQTPTSLGTATGITQLS
jgi:hypothetical protein